MRIALLPLCLTAAACATSTTAPTKAVSDVSEAKLLRADGSEAGVATLSKQDDGIWLELSTSAPGQGKFGVHLHSVGRCDGPDFSTAGPHWNPVVKQHGFDNPAGAHRGDLPNIGADTNGRLYQRQIVRDAQWSGDGGLFDADGVSIIVHEKADDYQTDPSGNSGKRIYCGVFGRE